MGAKIVAGYTKNRDGYRVCTYCKVEKLLSADNFMSDAARKGGLSYDCRNCHKQRKLGRDRRKERWSAMTDEQKAKRRLAMRRYDGTPKGRAISLINAYKKIDACDFSADELVPLLTQPCIHCGTIDAPRGLDRVDNSGAHTKDNVVPSCAACNFARGDRFTFAEMQIIGKVIREVIASRKA